MMQKQFVLKANLLYRTLHKPHSYKGSEMTQTIKINFKYLENGKDLPLPVYSTPQSAGADLYAAIEAPITLKPLERTLVPCGFSLELPEDYEAQIRPRSGLAFKNGVTVLNTPGTIDADYRGEIKILLVNLSNEAFTINRADRVAQMIIAPVTQGQFEIVSEINDTVRSAGGFGSTGVATKVA
jgi:dUTP pyrophosphatase